MKSPLRGEFPPLGGNYCHQNPPLEGNSPQRGENLPVENLSEGNYSHHNPPLEGNSSQRGEIPTGEIPLRGELWSSKSPKVGEFWSSKYPRWGKSPWGTSPREELWSLKSPLRGKFPPLGGNYCHQNPPSERNSPRGGEIPTGEILQGGIYSHQNPPLQGNSPH